jgi:Domain of unknown function (DUF4388)
MATSNQSNALLQKNDTGSIDGISTASFLQMLEQEHHSCKVLVVAEDKQGSLFFLDGELIDAEFEQLTGIEAAYAIVSWSTPSISLNEVESREKNIDHPLGYILLNSAKQQDEQSENITMNEPTITYTSNNAERNADFQAAVTILSEISSIRYFYLINKAGKIVAHSAPNATLGELIIYCIITSNNLRKSFKVKSPRRIHMQMEDGTSLLIVPKDGKILGMILNPDSSAIDVADQIHSAFAIK